MAPHQNTVPSCALSARPFFLRLLFRSQSRPRSSHAASANRRPSAASSTAPPAAGIRFDNIHLGLAANPPAPCTAPFYGTITARAPDGALCLCHQSYDGKQSFWEQLGTGKACWPDKK